MFSETLPRGWKAHCAPRRSDNLAFPLFFASDKALPLLPGPSWWGCHPRSSWSTGSCGTSITLRSVFLLPTSGFQDSCETPLITILLLAEGARYPAQMGSPYKRCIGISHPETLFSSAKLLLWSTGQEELVQGTCGHPHQLLAEKPLLWNRARVGTEVWGWAATGASQQHAHGSLCCRFLVAGSPWYTAGCLQHPSTTPTPAPLPAQAAPRQARCRRCGRCRGTGVWRAGGDARRVGRGCVSRLVREIDGVESVIKSSNERVLPGRGGVFYNLFTEVNYTWRNASCFAHEGSLAAPTTFTVNGRKWA